MFLFCIILIKEDVILNKFSRMLTNHGSRLSNTTEFTHICANIHFLLSLIAYSHWLGVIFKQLKITIENRQKL